MRKLLSLFSPLTATGGVGVCPLCWAASASFLSYIGLGAFIPFWRKITITFLLLGLIGFIVDYRRHRNIVPLILLAVGGTSLYLGRYIFVIQPKLHVFSGIEGFAGWPIWGPGAALVIIAVFFNRRLFRVKVRGHLGDVTPSASEESLFTCPECSLQYREKAWAEKCERWCREHKSCNLDIIKHAVP